MGYPYYGLSHNPFDKQYNNPNNYFNSDDYKQIVSRLNHLKDIRGIGLISALPGMGKSLAIKSFCESLNPNLYKVIYICLSTVSVSEFYRELCDSLGIEEVTGKNGRFNAIKEHIASMYKDRRQTLIIVIDEAQYLNASILRDLKMLMNFNYDSLNCFALVLCGEPYLKTTLNKQIHAALKQRITVHYECNGLSSKEIDDYVLHKIKSANGSENIIDSSALQAINGCSSGNPRIIDNIMSDAILIGEQLNKKVIDAEVIMAAIENAAL